MRRRPIAAVISGLLCVSLLGLSGVLRLQAETEEEEGASAPGFEVPIVTSEVVDSRGGRKPISKLAAGVQSVNEREGDNEGAVASERPAGSYEEKMSSIFVRPVAPDSDPDAGSKPNGSGSEVFAEGEKVEVDPGAGSAVAAAEESSSAKGDEMVEPSSVSASYDVPFIEGIESGSSVKLGRGSFGPSGGGSVMAETAEGDAGHSGGSIEMDSPREGDLEMDSSYDGPVGLVPGLPVAQVVDPAPEGAVTAQEIGSWADGYFPTRDDKLYLGDKDYRRSTPLNHYGPDFRSQAAMGLVGYEDPDISFYDRHAGFYDPVENFLGFMAPRDQLFYDFGEVGGPSFTADADWPFFMTTMDPDRAHVKAGPLYLDFMYLSAGVLYSDYDGDQKFAEGEEDGWLSYVGLGVRAVFQATEHFYLSAAGQLVYLPQENRVGFRIGAGDGGLAAGLSFNYDWDWKDWDFLFFDYFRVSHIADIYSGADTAALQRAGRYTFGIPDYVDRTNSYFDSESGVFSNQVGLRGVSPFGLNWRKEFQFDHTDYFQGYDFDRHQHRDHAGALVGYNGSRLPFSPSLSYDVDSYDYFDSSYHRLRLNFAGRISENVRMDGGVGYLWSVGRWADTDGLLWNLGLTHEINSRTRQSIRGGQNFFTNDLVAEFGYAEYLRYDLIHRFSDRIRGDLFAQWSDYDTLGPTDLSYIQELYGASLSVYPWDYTMLKGSVYHQRRREDGTGDTSERLIVEADSTHQILSRTTLHFYYRFEDADRFDEHLGGAEVRRAF